MSESRRLSRIVAPTMIGVLALGGAYQVGKATTANATHEAARHQADKNASLAYKVDDTARQLEFSLNEQLNNPKLHVRLDTWQGIVSRPSAVGMDSEYADPIILNPGSHPESGPSSDPSNPSYLGVIQGSPKEGIKVVPVKYTADMQFDAAADKPERQVDVYSTEFTDQGSVAGYELVAYDPAGETQVVHQYGHGIITPGRELS